MSYFQAPKLATEFCGFQHVKKFISRFGFRSGDHHWSMFSLGVQLFEVVVFKFEKQVLGCSRQHCWGCFHAVMLQVMLPCH